MNLKMYIMLGLALYTVYFLGGIFPTRTPSRSMVLAGLFLVVFVIVAFIDKGFYVQL